MEMQNAKCKMQNEEFTGLRALSIEHCALSILHLSRRVCLLLLAAIAIPAAAAAAPAQSAEAGKALYQTYSCYACHGHGGQGGNGARLSPRRLPLPAFIAFVRGTRRMPSYSPKVLSDAQLADLWTYIGTFPAPRPASNIPLLTQILNEK
jgi:mono/diheme cytochrome c family protein